MKQMREIIYAIWGSRIWQRMTKPYDIRTDNFFLIYPGEEHLITYMKKYMYSYMYEKKAVKAVCLTVHKKAADSLLSHFKGNSNIEVVLISPIEAKMLLAAYRFHAVSDKFMVVSLKKMYERNLDLLIGQKQITEEDVFVAGLFTLKLKKEGIRCEKRTDWSFRVRT